MATSKREHRNLCQIFDAAATLEREIETNDEPANSESFSDKLSKCVEMLEDLTVMVSKLGMFSTNEDVEEVATDDLRYFLLPALLGQLTLKRTAGDRLENVKIAEVYYRDFLSRCKEYGITSVSLPSSSLDENGEIETKPPSRLSDLSKQRDEKIRLYKQQKANEAKVMELGKLLDSDRVDDEVKREYFLVLLDIWIHRAVENLNMIEMEKNILKHVPKTKAKDVNNITSQKPTKSAKVQSKPIILTRDAAQAEVFGAGYPSLPVMTVEEWFAEKYSHLLTEEAQAELRQSMQKSTDPEFRMRELEKQDLEKEAAMERDDPDALKKAREMDDWKDDHKRGYGNRMNRS